MNKIRKGDIVVVITGKDKGKTGKVLAIVKGGEKLIVEGVNIVKKAVKDNPNENQKGGIIDKTMPIHRSNVMVYDTAKQKGSRVGIRVLKDGQRVRVLKVSDQVLDVNV
jgi:large subunit ribosomal protein L24